MAADHSPQIVLVGVSHRRASLALRESLAFPSVETGAAVEMMCEYVPEGVLLSTCHRVELYAASTDLQVAIAQLKRFWSEQRGVPVGEFEPLLYCMVGKTAVEHLFAVASGTDSAIVGEPQILGQVREALREASEHGAAGPVLTALFLAAVRAGRRARVETGIGRSAASVSFAAAELARRAWGDLRSTRVLLVGAGKMGELAVRNLLDRGVAAIDVVGRCPERARELADHCGRAVTLGRLEDALRTCDIVISCTSAPHHVITKTIAARAMKERSGRPLLLIDIAVPRDIEPAAGELAGVRLYNIDDLESAVAENVRTRRAEARKVTPIIAEEVTAFERWLATRRVVPTITALRARAEAIRQEELTRTAAVLDRLPEADRKRIEALTLAIEKKLLHQPIALLRAAAATGNGHETEAALRELFALEVVSADGLQGASP